MSKKYKILIDVTMLCGKDAKPAGIPNDTRWNVNILKNLDILKMQLFCCAFRSKIGKHKMNRIQRFFRNIKRIYSKITSRSCTILSHEISQKSLLDLECGFSDIDKSQNAIVIENYITTLNAKGYDFVLSPWVSKIAVTNSIHLIRMPDLLPFECPSLCNSSVIRYFTSAIKQNSEAKNTFFICISEPVAQKMAARYPHLENRIFVVPCCVPLPQNFQDSTFVKPDFEYVVMCSTIEPRKNHMNAISAFEQFITKYHNKNIKLLIVGNYGWMFDEIKCKIQEAINKGFVVHKENVQDAERNFLIKNSLCLLYPSFGEGFGLPPVEALYQNVPSIVSDIQEHKWVLSQDGALFCSPHDVSDIASKLEDLIVCDIDGTKREKLLNQGKQAAERFLPQNIQKQWVETLEKIIKIYEN